MTTMEQLLNMTPEQRTKYEKKVARALLTRFVVVPIVTIAAVIFIEKKFK